MTSPFVLGIVGSGLPHPLLCPDANPAYAELAAGWGKAREQLLASGADVLIVYSTMWPSVIGHQIQARPNPEWVHVDELFHSLGSIPYRFEMDAEFAAGWRDAAEARGLSARTIDYHGFPIDTGSITALKMLTPNNEIPAVIVSSNVYADRAETVVLAKACRDALAAQGKKAAAVCVMSLSNRLFTEWIDPAADRIHSAKDEEWNRKLLEFLGDGRLEDVAQLSRAIQGQIRVRKVVNFKPMWWLSAAMGAHNRYDGAVHAYGPIHGTGACVATLSPSSAGIGDKEFDEDDVEVYAGDRGVLSGAASAPPPEGHPPRTGASTPTPPAPAASPASASASAAVVRTSAAPAPVGAYPHARRVGDLLYLSGVGPRQPGTNAIPGGPIRDGDGNPLDYDIEAQTQAVIQNVRVILEASGSSLDRVLDITSFLVDMERDFAGYNAVYAEHFAPIQATRTTLAIRGLPTPIAVEMKVIALAGDAPRPA